MLKSKNQVLTETEGYESRKLDLFHVTSKDSAYKIILKNIFPRPQGKYGNGIYLVETEELANRIEMKDKAIVFCQVNIGISLVLRKENMSMNEKKLKDLGCASVYGVQGIYEKEYVIYNYKQVLKVFYAKIDQKIVRPLEKEYKCTNSLCAMQATFHRNQECKLLCQNKPCIFFNSHHFPPCKIICADKKCELVGTQHKSRCQIRCFNQHCIKFRNYHKGPCEYIERIDTEIQSAVIDVISEDFDRNGYRRRLDSTEYSYLPKKVKRSEPAWKCINNACLLFNTFHSGDCKNKDLPEFCPRNAISRIKPLIQPYMSSNVHNLRENSMKSVPAQIPMRRNLQENLFEPNDYQYHNFRQFAEKNTANIDIWKNQNKNSENRSNDNFRPKKMEREDSQILKYIAMTIGAGIWVFMAWYFIF